MSSIGTESHERRVVVHFDNVSIHNSEPTREHLAHFGFKRMEHSPDLAPGFFKDNEIPLTFAAALMRKLATTRFRIGSIQRVQGFDCFPAKT
jgi:hypothetical protein